MALTKDFRETVLARAQREPAFRRALLQEAVEQMLAGDVDTGKALIRNYVNATVGFQGLAQTVGTPASSLMRMFGPKGNPKASNLVGVLAELQRQEGIGFVLKVATRQPAPRRAGTIVEGGTTANFSYDAPAELLNVAVTHHSIFSIDSEHALKGLLHNIEKVIAV